MLYALSPELAVSIVTEQAAALNHPPMTTPEVLDALTATVPTFAAAIRSHVSARAAVLAKRRPARREPGDTC